MKNLLKHLLEVRAERREARGEQGFSLIELIVVIAIIGILIAVAIPVYGGIQDNAAEKQLKNGAATGLGVAAAAEASGEDVTAALAATKVEDLTLSFAGEGDTLCVTATAVPDGPLDRTDVDPQTSGPGCA